MPLNKETKPNYFPAIIWNKKSNEIIKEDLIGHFFISTIMKFLVYIYIYIYIYIGLAFESTGFQSQLREDTV